MNIEDYREYCLSLGEDIEEKLQLFMPLLRLTDRNFSLSPFGKELA